MTGYVAAAGMMAALLRRSIEGGSYHVKLSLAHPELAPLLNVSVSSLKRYQSGERDTPDPIAARLEECAEGGGREAFAEGGHHAAGNEDVPLHGP